jgi:SAM-dependent methyltransferase
MINLGCGRRIHSAWVNVDIAPSHPDVQKADLSRGIPFPDETFEAVYHSNVLEHIRREHTGRFMSECRRVLRPGGILRVAVPDLERICTLYLDRLQRADDGDARAAADYDWIMLELLDQMVRERGGGGMAEHLRQDPLPGEGFILERIGDEGRELLEALRAEPPKGAAQGRSRRWSAVRRSLRRRVINLLFGRQTYEALQIGRFRLEGEVHQWMYDRFSLARLMVSSGFTEPTVMTPYSSRIPGWPDYQLEVGADGAVHKPDSFVMEALKPM